MASTRLNELCDQAINRLERVVELVKQIKAQDAASANAKRWLDGMCRHIPYEGDVVCVSVESILAELEEIEADETFGPREEEKVS